MRLTAVMPKSPLPNPVLRGRDPSPYTAMTATTLVLGLATMIVAGEEYGDSVASVLTQGQQLEVEAAAPLVEGGWREARPVAVGVVAGVTG